MAVVGLSALWGVSTLDVEQARVIEDRMQMAKEEAEGEIARAGRRNHDRTTITPSSQAGPATSGADKADSESDRSGRGQLAINENCQHVF